MQNCVGFTNPCINVLPPSLTCEYYHMVVELHMLQCIAVYLQHALAGVSWET